MQTINSLISHEVGYLNALKNAVPFPETKAPEILPAANPQLPLVMQPSITPPGKAEQSKIPVWIWFCVFLAGIGAGYLWDLNRKKKPLNCKN